MVHRRVSTWLKHGSMGSNIGQYSCIFKATQPSIKGSMDHSIGCICWESVVHIQGNTLAMNGSMGQLSSLFPRAIPTNTA